MKIESNRLKRGILQEAMAVPDDVKKAQKRIHDKKYRAVNKEKIAIRKKKYAAANADKERARKKTYHAANKEKIAVKGKTYYEKNRAQVLAKKKEYNHKHKKVILAKSKSWHLANRAFKNAYDRACYARKKAIAANKVPPPLPKLADFRAQHEASGSVAPATSTDAAPELTEEDPHPLAATTKNFLVAMTTFLPRRSSWSPSPTSILSTCASVDPSRAATSAPSSSRMR
ncbi:hypothetical protein SDRG_17141 [Saprolegnia diclina VS20]|uniref:Uncharacterized protein n=1 Tax=Saprolegnia diclina (strain VS20) TaxID=1156394 RepID=T0PVE4_SAPDV|nr:hypothetical protein SDRG_17141 [Saprolegnia diclina VS20]EQC24965.1 hypothetical protein SDRG_17141 [Saprolegnia diclina VS20]|eukprot:XP_008621598.1 hypothetical protein SDRG_17141 [Saprolegnia diclina VS20]